MVRSWRIGVCAALVTLGACLSSPDAEAKTTAHKRRAPAHAPDLSRMALSFSDEFDDLDLWDGHAGVWRTNYGYADPSKPSYFTLVNNGEEQLYVDAGFQGTGHKPLGLFPFAVKDGILTISATPMPERLKSLAWRYGYASGLITTRESFSQTYGYFEMRAWLPAGKGLWPAFWLSPMEAPSTPEIDIVEMLGQEPETFYVVAHTRQRGKHLARGKVVHVGDLSRGFHTYGVLWTPRKIVWYLDGAEVFRTTTPPDLHRPMYILANLAVGGRWPGSPNATTPFPAKMRIDYIRAYALKASDAPAAHPPAPTPVTAEAGQPPAGPSPTDAGGAY